MSRKQKQLIEAGLDKQPLLGVILGGLLFFAAPIMVTVIFPQYAEGYFYISTPIGIFGYVNLIWVNIKPSLLGRLFVNMSFSILCAIMAFRAFSYLSPQFSLWGGVFIVIAGIFAYSFPIWNPSTTNLIRDEMFAPKTKIGKFLFKMSLAILPIAGIAGAMAETFLHRANKPGALAAILLFLGLLMLVGLPFAYPYPKFRLEGKDKK